MPWRYWKPHKISKKLKSPSTHSVTASLNKRAEDILDLIRNSQSKNIWHGFPELQPVENRPCTADAWQIFKKNFVKEYGGEKVRDTGMTHSEFWEYFKTGRREADEGSKLRRLLKELHEDES